MCPACYFPWIVTILGLLGVNAHLWVDENPFLSVVVLSGGFGLTGYGVWKLIKFYREKVCERNVPNRDK